MKLRELLQKRAENIVRMKGLIDGAKAANRDLNEAETQEWETLDAEVKDLDTKIKTAEQAAGRQARVDALARTLDDPVGQPYRPPATMDRQAPQLDDAGFENLGEFIAAARFGDPKGRVANLSTGKTNGIEVPDKFKAQVRPVFRNAWEMGSGEGGGFAIGEQRLDEMLMIGPESSIVRPRARVIPPGDPPDGKITIPAFKQGSAGVFGGVEVAWIGEGGDKPETAGNLREVSLQPQEAAAHTVVTDKLLRNWKAASPFISGLLRGAVLSAEDFSFLRGNGVGKPTGITVSGGALAAHRTTANQVTYADVVAMLAKLLPESVGNALFVANQTLLPQLAVMTDGGGRFIFIQGDATRGIPTTLAGIPIRFTGKTPVLGTKGDLMLVDLGYYLIKDGSGPFIAASEHVYFKQNKTVIKIFWNVDGTCWVDEPLTLEDGSTQTSPYVLLDVPAA